MSAKIGVEIDGARYITFFDLQAGTTGSIALSTICDFQTRAVIKIFLCTDDSKILLNEILLENIPPAKAGEPKIDLQASLKSRYRLEISVRLNDRLYREDEYNLKMYLKRPVSFRPAFLTVPLAGVILTAAGILFVNFSGLYHNDRAGKPVEPAAVHPTGETLFFPSHSIVPSLSPSPSPSSSSLAEASLPEAGSPVKTEEEAGALPAVTVSLITSAQPTTAGAAVAAPESAAAQIGQEIVYFQPGRSQILPAAGTALDGLLPVLQANPLAHVRIEGHCALYETEEERYELSVQRVKAVYAYLVKKGWQPPATLKLIGYGGQQPVTKEAEGQQLNRRVEIIVEEQG